ncbi:histidine kinase dimerization/phospho-acceptor domain-containing protein [Paraglaciecola sp. 2405UD69-4]|uniref:histidine kinase dimerization/phospho-acceptor domain-containing protein n=1 Tax=Paraglaciecola sp. 2405UD69-4 TaxID=3391836 RepID=UPI0039C92C88
MYKFTASEFDKFVHNMRNPLNSITLNAELGKVLIDGQASTEQIKQVFSKILQQCKDCDEMLGEIRRKNKENS